MISQEKNSHDISIVFCGGAGQGIQTVERLLTRLLKNSGLYVFATKEYMSRVRGGSNSTQIRLADKPVQAPIERIDLLIPLDQKAISHVSHRLDEQTMIVGDREKIKPEREIIDLPFSEMAQDIGGSIYANTIAVGFIMGLVEAELSHGENYLKDYFNGKKEKIIQENIKALQKGYQEAEKFKEEGKIDLEKFASLKKSKQLQKDILINGAEAVGLGAISGGCHFIASYPMSPSTGVLVFLSQHAREYGIIAEQAEDEIAAVNMSIGAWYAGTRGMVTTSGGGLALMGEGISLAGITESPLVIHLAQRPGPATGLATRTEQGDLNLALYAGHGDFPRIILAPGQIEEAYELTRQAFDWADRFQVPVFILTDQYLMDSYYNVKELNVPEESIRHYIEKTEPDYQRYQLEVQNGISPRGIPYYGKGLVRLDSHEHNESGLVTEDMPNREKMVQKRLAKLKPIKDAALEPKLIGPSDYQTIFIGWGSTYPIIKDALDKLNLNGTAFLHFQQAYPLSEKTADFLKKAERIISIENNATGQFGKLLEEETGYKVNDYILQYSGLPFYVDELAEMIRKIVSEKGGQ